ncbi:pyridoxal-phosphate dependent enzyme [Streptomyces globisporus]|uniref:threonine synthase n=1 Tax=Streptomyces globisporus TaxID=1908 RepID=UPI00099C09CC|nr:pyridoxal-phosphate dependent enzyme [Streptomyces globisporus]
MPFVKYAELIDSYARGSSEKVIHHCCIRCGKESGDPTLNRCPECSGAMDAIYDLDYAAQAEWEDSPNPLLRYFPLIPVRDPKNVVWLGDGNSPCIQSHKLGAEIGLPGLFLKDESFNPTRSTKDRIASMGISRFAELGIRKLALASTGNSSTAYGRAVQVVPGFEAHIFAGRAFVHRLNYGDHPRVKTYAIDGEFATAGNAAQRYAEENGLFSEGGFFSLSRREGLKLAYLEAFDAMPATPDYVFQAVSSGMGLLGAYKGALEYLRLGRLSRLPRFVAVQQASCAPMAHAYAEDSETIQDRHIVRNPKGPAYAILRGNPTPSYPYIRDVARESGGDIRAVTTEEIERAKELLRTVEGIEVCHAAATAFAGLIAAVADGRVPWDANVLVNLTGGVRPHRPSPSQVIDFEIAEADL